MPENENSTLVLQIKAGFTRVGSVCQAIEAKADTNTSNLTSLASTLRSEIATAKAEAISTVTGEGTKEALDTLKEIADYAEANKGLIDGLTALAAGHVHFDKDQSATLTAEQKTQARTNIGAAADAEVVKIVSQDLSANAKSQALSNIGAASASDLATLQSTVTSLSNDVVKTSASQGLNTTQQGNARANIAAASADDLTTLADTIGDLTSMDFVTTFNTAYTAAQSGN